MELWHLYADKRRIAKRYFLMSFMGVRVPNKRGTGPKYFWTRRGAARYVYKMNQRLLKLTTEVANRPRVY